MSQITTPSTAGIIESQTGERHIPSSTRADGTKRKEIKIRPGYKPVEDVQVYKNRSAESWKTHASNGVPGAQGLLEKKSKDSAVSIKNAKKREAKKRSNEANETKKVEAEEAIQQVNPEAEREKKARNLRKKLKQARELKNKKEGGFDVLPEQLAKIIKIDELIRELNALDIQSKTEINTEENNTLAVS
ncbi:hypothetical protein GcM3_039004 [Golovinomyces cichoracearum]|uniref:WIBG Mago-binding domain-containing protein n=1 Tax=Golovinomyces cichoracearum TaxID=62708 RepID=A0A420J2W5_9PEZI|nr:hypothetical protein GcM3_039004 [Golovinomyces cichoracearum]